MGGYSPGLGTWVGFDSLVFIRRRRVTWQAGPIRCGSQRASDEGWAHATHLGCVTRHRCCRWQWSQAGTYLGFVRFAGVCALAVIRSSVTW